MTSVSTASLAAEWRDMLAGFPEGVLQHVRKMAELHRKTLASHFYEKMLQHEVASRFLSHEQVKSRLHGSMMRWIVTVFSPVPQTDLTSVVDLQTQVGMVHARIDIPVYIVLRGARSLKQGFQELLHADARLDSSQRLDAINLVSSCIDLAMEIMSQAYSSSHDRNARAEESYRLFSVAQNIATEKERQRAALLDWENELMFEHAVGSSGTHLPRIGSADFGLWFRHKGAYAFQGTSEAALILEAMAHIDETLLALLEQAGRPDAKNGSHPLRLLREQTRSIGFHLERLFDQSNELEAGRDALTRLLSRKFLPVVLSKEVDYARHSGTDFAVLAIDIDHFKQVNDNYGHEAGDHVLQQFSILLGNTGRGADYVFRLGGEEFLMLLVDTDLGGAMRVAENLRKQIDAETFRLPGERNLRVTASIGVALHNGHPDYLQLLRRADEALYKAKKEGRNRVVMGT